MNYRLCLIAALLPAAMQADELDMTNSMPGAPCDEQAAQYWQIEGNTNGVLECDTWSARGNKDGSQMTTPFMEYWVNQAEGPLSDAVITHQDVTGLPTGSYRVQMHVRCYDESGQQTQLSGVTMFVRTADADGQSIDMQLLSACDGLAVSTASYNGQTYSNATLTADFDLTAGQVLQVGLTLHQTNCNWVAWKDLRLIRTDAAAPPITTGTYYMQNVATGLYVNAGLYGGTQAVLGQHPQAVMLTGSADSGWLFDLGYSSDSYNHYMGQDSQSGRIALDTSPQTWKVATDDDGISTVTDAQGQLLGYDPSTMALTLNATQNEGTRWKIVSHSEMLRRLLAAGDGQQADATFLIDNPRMDRNYQNNLWEGSSFTIGGENGLWFQPGNYCAEVWNANFDVYQVLTNIPNGHYRLTAQGFYRYNTDWGRNTNSIALESHQDGTEQLYAQLYANGQSTPLQSIASEADNIALLGLQASESGLPYSMSESSYAFTAGLYADNAVETDVTDHTLVVGVRKYAQDGCDWTVWDNLALTMLQAGDNTDYDPDGPQADDHDYDSATPDNPVELTDLIANADFSSSRGWSGSPGIGGPQEDRNAEKFYTNFDVYQELSGLPNGWYRLTARGFYRYGDCSWEQQKSYYGQGWEENDANNVWAMYTIPYAVISHRLGTEKQLATLYANRVEAPLPSIFSYAVVPTGESADIADPWNWVETEFGWVPNNPTAAAQCFAMRPDNTTTLLVPVSDGKLRLGVKKQLGYKNDWAVWDDIHLYYLGKQDFHLVEGVSLPTSLTLSAGQQQTLSAVLSPADVPLADSTLIWTSANTNVVRVSQQGIVTAVAPGSTTVTALAPGSMGGSVAAQTSVSVSEANGSARLLRISEIQVSNLDMFLDPSYNYGGWIELHNPSSHSVSLGGLWIGMDGSTPKHRLTAANGYVPAGGYKVIWFDHATGSNGQIDDKLSMDGGIVSLWNDAGSLLTSQSYPAAVSRTSYALQNGQWGITAQPTPGAAPVKDDDLLDAATAQRLPEPAVSHTSQLFTAPFTMSVTVPDGATLRYTTDGSTPTIGHGLTSTDGIFTVSQTTTLRLRLFRQGQLPSPVRTLSYIYKDKDYMLPVLSVVSAPEHFYNDTIGVFVSGCNGIGGSGINYPCNWNQDWDRPVAFNYFPSSATGADIASTNASNTSFDTEATLSRFGGWSRAWYPYNFKLKAQAQYEGRNFMEYPFFPLKSYNKHKVLQVRNGGNDLLCRIRDAALQQMILTSGLHLDCQDLRPVHSFINGHYQGMMNLREPSNKHYAYANYGIDTDSLDQMELTGGVAVKAGTADAFWQWSALAQNATDPDVYQQICNMVDVEEFANYMAVQLFLGGDDWPTNNCKAFKGNDGKFHIVLFDIDQALRFDAYAFTRLQNNRNCPLISIFFNMLRNEQFAQLFRTCFSLVAGSVFDPARSLEILNSLAAEMEPALNLEGGSTEPTAGYMRSVMTEARKQTMLEAFGSWRYSYANGTGQQLQLSTSLPEARLSVNGVVVPTGHFSGLLFGSNTLQAEAPEGYTFSGWQEADGHTLSSNATLDIDGMGTLSLTAVFQPLATDQELLADLSLPVKVNELSAGNSVYINDLMKKNDWIELYNTTDVPLDAAGLYLSDNPEQPMKYQIQATEGQQTVIPAKGRLIVWADKLVGTTQLHANFKLGNREGQMVMLSSSSQFVAANQHYFSLHPDMQVFADGMTYDTHRGDQSVGRFPDGGRLFYQMWRPTIDQPNLRLSTDQQAGQDMNLMNYQPNLFAMEMERGWNWVSHPLRSGIDLDSLPAAATAVTGSAAGAVRQGGQGWSGQLRWLDTGRLYKVQMSQADTYATTQPAIDAPMPQQLQPGWNWVGYPVSGTQTLAEAMRSFVPENGDAIIGQDGFALYRAGRWQGTLSSLDTGKGYQYRSVSSKTLTFSLPDVALNLRRAPLRQMAAPDQYGYDPHAYPDMMGVVATLTADGQAVPADSYTLLALCDEQCRGVAQWVDGLLWLSACGNSGETLQFVAISNADGQTYNVEQQLSFTPGVQGTVEQPVLLILGQQADDNAIQLTQNGTHRQVEACYNLGGTKTGTAPSGPGIHILKYKDGSSKTVLK